jgi:Na+/glutamate symporter
MKLSDRLERQRKRNPNKIHPDEIAMNTLMTFLTTSKGWIVRQGLKLTTYVTAPLAVWLETQGHGDQAATVTAAVAALATAAMEIGLSYAARKNR